MGLAVRPRRREHPVSGGGRSKRLIGSYSVPSLVSGAIDEDVVRTVDSGRETLGAMLSAAQSHLQKVFLVFVAGLMLTIWALRAVVWTRMQSDLHTNPNIQVVAVTPFDVILLQVKIGLVVGGLLALPFLLYYARDGLRERDLWIPDRIDLSRWKIAALVLASALLLLVGASYAYFLFFPLMLDFLASNAVQAGFEPTYSIVLWAQFIFLLTISFGLAAQLPLVMSGLAYAEIVPYETFRDKWKYAVVAIFVFGALFSPPDPFTQIMWAVPLLFLYGFSLYLAKVVVTAKRGSEQIDVWATTKSRWNLVAGSGVLGFVAVYAFYTRGGVALALRLRPLGRADGQREALVVDGVEIAAVDGDELTFSADITRALDLQKVVISAFYAAELAGEPGRFRYVLDIAESPPLPPPAQVGGFGGLDDFGVGDLGFDTDILDDLEDLSADIAGAVDQALDVVDQLGALAGLANLDALGAGGLFEPLNAPVNEVRELGNNIAGATSGLISAFS